MCVVSDMQLMSKSNKTVIFLQLEACPTLKTCALLFILHPVATIPGVQVNSLYAVKKPTLSEKSVYVLESFNG